MSKAYYVAVILFEFTRWLSHEVRNRHFGSFGLRFEEFLVNELAVGNYGAGRLRAVLLFVLIVCKDGSQPKCLDVLFKLFPEMLPLESLQSEVLAKLKALAPPEQYPAVAERLRLVTKVRAT